MDCKEMNELKDGENVARALLRSECSDDMKLMYASWANEAMRIQRLHWDRCAECQSAA